MRESNELRSLGCRRVGGFGEMSEFKREINHHKKEVTFQMDAHLNSSVGTKIFLCLLRLWLAVRMREKG